MFELGRKTLESYENTHVTEIMTLKYCPKNYH